MARIGLIKAYVIFYIHLWLVHELNEMKYNQHDGPIRNMGHLLNRVFRHKLVFCNITRKS